MSHRAMKEKNNVPNCKLPNLFSLLVRMKAHYGLVSSRAKINRVKYLSQLVDIDTKMSRDLYTWKITRVSTYNSLSRIENLTNTSLL